ncbi:MAG: alkaline phosphatase [Alphaproteobacteria bacterium]|nr:alkaline phosphatase [Alphaproteobacteria bacterium]
MKKILFLFVCLLISKVSLADNVILMIGDGMGENHLKCASADKAIYIMTLPIKGWVHTHSANNQITDSAASATAYACGEKTNNRMLGKFAGGDDCQTIAEKAVQEGLSVGIYSTDYATGATPSAFFAHVYNRNDRKTIASYKLRAQNVMDIKVPVSKISQEVEAALNKLKNNTKGFFAMFEGALIDTYSHHNKLDKMKEELYDFDLAVKFASDFVRENPDTTLIVLADHETGGLSDECRYTQKSHSGTDVPVYADGKHAELFDGKQDNIEIYKKMYQILFEN